MNSRGFFFYYFGIVILLIISCLFISISTVIGTIFVLLVLFLQVFIYFATKISTRQLLLEKKQATNCIISHCDGKIQDITMVKADKIYEILVDLSIEEEGIRSRAEESEEWYCINIVNYFPQFPERRSPVDGKIKIFNLLAKKIKNAVSQYISQKYKNYNIWYQIKTNRKGNNNKKIFLLCGENSFQKGSGISEFIPFLRMFNDSSELFYPSFYGTIQQTELISAFYFYSSSLIFLPAQYLDLNVVKNQTLVAAETVLATFKKKENMDNIQSIE